ncbi:MAG TPA: hypothetical protein VH186_33735 [Chloroflexia bacterium]|nr:hypothetical protein [Chloroflexia bacterium]
MDWVKRAVRKVAGLLSLVLTLFIVAACGEASVSNPGGTVPVPTAFPTLSAETSRSGVPSIFAQTGTTPTTQIPSAGATAGITRFTTTIGQPETLTELSATTGLITSTNAVSTIPTMPPPTPSPLPVKTIVPTPPVTTKPVFTLTSTKQPQPSVQSGYLKGRVLAGPTCPVERADNPCPPNPVAGRSVRVRDQKQSTTLKTLVSDSSGYFTTELPAGSYMLELDTNIRPFDRNSPHPVTILAG